MIYLWTVVGLAILIFAGEALVRGAVNMSLRLGVPALIVSLTIVSFGTSAPELLVAVQAVLADAPGIALGNVVGSNTANVLLVLGIPALISGISLARSETRKSYVIMLGASLLFILVCAFGPITRLHGLILLAALALILFDQGRDALAHRRNGTPPLDGVEVEGANPEMRWWRILVYLAVGIVGLPLGADLLIDGATGIARTFGVSDTVIGLTLVAIGTSLPELATSVVAAVKRHAELALGNVIGSNIFNLLGIIGVAAMAGRIPVDPEFLRLDLWVMLGASLALAPFILRRRDVTALWGAVFCIIYGGYLWILIS